MRLKAMGTRAQVVLMPCAALSRQLSAALMTFACDPERRLPTAPKQSFECTGRAAAKGAPCARERQRGEGRLGANTLPQALKGCLI